MKQGGSLAETIAMKNSRCNTMCSRSIRGKLCSCHLEAAQGNSHNLKRSQLLPWLANRRRLTKRVFSRTVSSQTRREQLKELNGRATCSMCWCTSARLCLPILRTSHQPTPMWGRESGVHICSFARQITGNSETATCKSRRTCNAIQFDESSDSS